MSTVPVVLVIHHSWFARAASWVKHEALVVKNVLLKIQSEMPAVDAEIKKIAPTAEALSDVFVPGSGAFEQHLLDSWGVLAASVNDLGDAAGANGISVSYDAKFVAAVKSFLPQIKAYMSPHAGPTPVVPSSPAAPDVATANG